MTCRLAATQNERLDLLRGALADRDREREFLAEERVEAVRQVHMQTKDQAVAAIQRSRVAALRKLANQRTQMVRAVIVARAGSEPSPVARAGRRAGARDRDVDLDAQAPWGERAPRHHRGVRGPLQPGARAFDALL